MGGARLAEPWLQCPAGILTLSHQVWWCLACKPSTPEVGAGGLEVQGLPCLHNKFKAILGHMRTCLNKQRRSVAG